MMVRWHRLTNAGPSCLTLRGKTRVKRCICGRRLSARCGWHLTPWLNHSWHVVLYVTARGLTTSPIPWHGSSLQIDFDFIDHVLWVRTSGGHFRQIMLKPTSVAEFYEDVMTALRELGVDVRITTMPCEIADCVPFEQDTLHSAYDPDYANRFWRVLLAASDVFAHFRTGFLGKSSPVHFFWGSFLISRSRSFSRAAPRRRHPGGVPHLPNSVAQEAYSHEVSSAGFWPGGGGADRLRRVLFVCLHPAPEGFAAASVKPKDASFDKELGEFLLPFTTPCAPRVIPMRPSWISCKAPTTPRRIWGSGTATRSNAASGSQTSRGYSRGT